MAINSQQLTLYPADGEVFELTLDGDNYANSPLEMVRRDGFGYLVESDWRHSGPTISGRQTCHGKLVSIGFCENFSEVRPRLVVHGTLPEGQWREAFKAKFHNPGREGHIGFADPSWFCSYGFTDKFGTDWSACRRFPFVYPDGHSNFHSIYSSCSERWRWFVLITK